MKHNNRSTYFWGFFLVLIGFLFLLQNFDMLDIGDIIGNFWPLIIVAIGIKILLENRYKKQEAEIEFNTVATPHTESSGFSGHSSEEVERISESNIFGDINIRFRSSSFQGGSVSNVFGDIHVDLTSVTPVEPEAKLYINGIFGDIVIHLPQGTALKLKANVIAGDLSARGNRRDGIFPAMEIQDEGYITADKKIFIQCSMIFGSVTII